ncbi:MAG: CCA tRNA nucleotidyltransferase [Dehalococcoidia bacterium]
MERCLPRQLLDFVNDISARAAGRGERVYLVGGIVRGLLLSGPATHSHLRFDLDLVVEGDAVGLAEQVAVAGGAKLLARHRFGTAKLKYQDFTLDLATARKETYARPGALPTVTPGTLKDDLMRRDFSINAMAISLAREGYGELIDPHQGKRDMEHRLIRVLHPASFSDDATRILRGVRYEQRLGFEFEAQTRRLLIRNIPMLDTISGDRIRHEVELILKEVRPEFAIRRLGELGVLQRIGACLRGDAWIAERFDRARGEKKSGQLPSLYFCLLVYSCDEAEVEQLLARLNMPVKLSRAMRDTLRIKASSSLFEKPCLKASEIYYLLHEYDPLAIQTNAIASESALIRSRLQLFLTKLRYVRTSLNGEELKRLDIPAGPKMGRIIRILHGAKLDGEVRTASEEKSLALSLKEVNLPASSEDSQE